MAKHSNLPEYYRRLRAHFGHQHWWPGDTAFEICVGAILTQNAAWTNVEKAIANLKRARALSPTALHHLSHRQVAALIRPSGYFNVKARRLKNFVTFLVSEYDSDLRNMFSEPWPALRERLLAINGIGPETADSILLYAGDKPVFVVDAYTKRVLARHGVVKSSTTYHEVQELFHKNLQPRRVGLYNDFHAQFVAVAKNFCSARVAHCDDCPLRPLLPATKSRR